MRCGVCGASRHKPYRTLGQWRLVRCLDCRVVYLCPRPSDEELAGLYSDRYFAERSIQDDHSPPSVEAEIQTRVPAAARLGAEVQPSVQWLDVGCASGYLLAAAKRLGFQTQGIEISNWAASFAQQSLGLEVFLGTLRGFTESVDSPRFNLITAMAYLEHSGSPGEDLRLMAKMLQPGGIVVVRVPNLKSFDRFWHGDAWHAWHVPFHLYHFTPSDLTHLFRSVGLTPYRLDVGFWNPMVHLREARLGDGLRADHPLEGRSRPPVGGSVRQSGANHSPSGRSRLKAIVGKVLSGRDMMVYGRKEP